jgi:hypothetical protein
MAFRVLALCREKVSYDVSEERSTSIFREIGFGS